MLDCLRIHRTEQELNAGLREKILAMRKIVNTAHEMRKEIEAIIKEQDLDRHTLYREA